MTSDYVELDRGCVVVQLGWPPNRELARRDDGQDVGPIGLQLALEELLAYKVAVIQGEPGSGKSEELHALHRRHGGLFIRLEQLVSESLAQILRDEELSTFNTWKAGSGEMLFCLDAVDEAKLIHEEHFARAIERISRQIGAALPRARFVITSRVSEWRAQTDLDIVRGLTTPEPKKVRDKARTYDDAVDVDDAPENRPTVVVATLQRLTPDQVERFAQGRGVPDTPRFLKALRDRNAMVFAARPLDVILLYGYWKDKGDLSGLTGLVEYMVEKLLAEVRSKERGDPLSRAKVREGAEYLAAAAILCKNLSFDIPEDGQIPSDVRLSVEAILPADWKPEERRALMNRALFDLPARGALAFHHRVHIEYLAAQWIERLMEHNCGYERLEDLLATRIGGDITLRSSLAPVAAWLVTGGTEPWRRDLRSLILATAPEIHLQYGDPEALTIEYRRQVLAAIVRKYNDRERVHLRVDPDKLPRLADDDLVLEINAYLIDESISDDLRCDLLMTVWEGALQGCVATVLRLFAKPDISDDLRSHCVLAIQHAGTKEQKQQLARLAHDMDELSNTTIGHIFEALYPAVINAEDALRLLSKPVHVGRHNYDLQYRIGPHLDHELKGADTTVFLRGFLTRLKVEPIGERSGLSRRYRWMMGFVPLCLERAISQSPRAEADRNLIVDAVLLLDEALLYGYVETPGMRDHTESLQKALEDAPELRRAVFWRRVLLADITLDANPFPLHKLSPMSGLARWTAEDVGWMLGDVRNRQLLHERVIAFSAAAFILGQRGSRWAEYLPRMAGLLAEPELRRCVYQFIRNKLFGRRVLWWHSHVKHGLLDKSRRLVRRRRYANLYHAQREKFWLWTHLSALRAGKFPGMLARVTDSMRSNGKNRFSVADWEPVRKKWGKLVADSVREGGIRSWRHYRPLWPHERQERNSIDRRVIIGLIGLQTLWQEGRLDFSQVERDEVELAVRYACSELNGFPEWFPELARARPADVTQVLSEVVEAEFAYPPELENVYEVVAKLAGKSAGSVAVNDALSGALSSSDPRNAKVLEQVLSALSRGSNRDVDTLAELAPTRVLEYEPGQTQWILWMAAWLGVDAAAALRYLQASLEGLARDESDRLMVLLCAELSGGPGRRRKSGVAAFLLPESLAIFIPLVHQYVRPSEDIDRVDKGVYSPDARDNAQDLRNRLWEALRSDESGEADAVLSSFLPDDRLADQRDWILSILDERRGKLSDPAAWSASDVREFAESFRHRPRSDYQLFRLVSRLVLNVKHEIEASQNATNRNQVRLDDREKAFQGFLARRLEDQSLKWFSVTQESEVDLEQRPDIHVNAPPLNTLPIEVKLANLNWTLRTLLERLETQVVGQYLRPATVNYGLYVIGNTQPGRQWRDGNGERIGFAELIELLKRRADELVAENPKTVHGLEVIGIDFSDPRATGE
ncbi:NACHT domain-containing protein [Paraburkholderia caribensis]|uniref:NACHT domain-containing protein n=1 Tax=Paraburkholderia caribensis TaxID=75105 RepID=UPI001CB4862C|nr:hypothetical protein [Paraburkholderia caribensis]CAG9251872.1 conserved hypothetical protein [Paraburkholderia caribensis]